MRQHTSVAYPRQLLCTARKFILKLQYVAVYSFNGAKTASNTGAGSITRLETVTAETTLSTEWSEMRTIQVYASPTILGPDAQYAVSHNSAVGQLANFNCDRQSDR